MKRFTLFFIAFLAVLLVSCVTPTITPTVSPLPTPTPFPSPLISSGDVAISAEGDFSMSAENLAAIVGVVFSLAFSYIPGIKVWFDSLESSHKQSAMGLALFAVAAAIFGLSCGGILDVVTCNQAGALGLVEVLIAALIANQSVYLITKR